MSWTDQRSPSWVTGPLAGFDTETTGVDPRHARLVTAALVIRDGKDTTRTWLADPGQEIPAAATRIHGISTEYAREHGRPAADVLSELADELHRVLKARTPIVAFNAPYDLEIVERELRRHGLPTLSDRLGDIRPVIDPLVLDRGLVKKRRGKRRLSNLLYAYGLSLERSFHTAEVDVQATLDLAQEMARRHPSIASMSLGELHAFQQDAHRAWAKNFADFLSRRRGEPVSICEQWPLPDLDG
ncbi:MAG: exonuclease domain-containing protein [Actinomycetaceae bacterium]|nr:exonuclease domain-containing protein [Actinomycetaceae bacterium]